MNIYVGNLPYSTGDAELRQIFEEFGAVDSASVVKDKFTGRSRGFGFVGAYGNTRDVDGKPVFTSGDIPPKGNLGDFQPRIYFGENNPEYSIVGGATGSDPVEFDFPDDVSANGQKNYLS